MALIRVSPCGDTGSASLDRLQLWPFGQLRPLVIVAPHPRGGEIAHKLASLVRSLPAVAVMLPDDAAGRTEGHVLGGLAAAYAGARRVGRPWFHTAIISLDSLARKPHTRGMNASVSIQVRVPYEIAKVLKRAAKARRMKLAAYVREAALRYTSAAAGLEPVAANADGHFTDRPA